MSKVKEINIERGFPTVEIAMNRLTNEITTAKMSGFRAVVVIHGFGSSGEGGAIKAASKRKLKSPMFSGILRNIAGGEEWYLKKTGFLGLCPELKNFERHIDGNQGVTVVLLKK